MVFHVISSNGGDTCSVRWKFECEPTVEYARLMTANTFHRVFGVNIFESDCRVVREFSLSNELSFFDNMFDPDR